MSDSENESKKSSSSSSGDKPRRSSSGKRRSARSGSKARSSTSRSRSRSKPKPEASESGSEASKDGGSTDAGESKKAEECTAGGESALSTAMSKMSASTDDLSGMETENLSDEQKTKLKTEWDDLCSRLETLKQKYKNDVFN
ncbi:hypothetical protein IAT38_003041 [Cryptococcus sp. DSM 104549]